MCLLRKVYLNKAILYVKICYLFKPSPILLREWSHTWFVFHRSPFVLHILYPCVTRPRLSNAGNIRESGIYAETSVGGGISPLPPPKSMRRDEIAGCDTWNNGREFLQIHHQSSVLCGFWAISRWNIFAHHRPPTSFAPPPPHPQETPSGSLCSL